MQNNLNLIGRYKTSVLFFSYIISSINIQWDNIHITRQRQQGTSTSEKFRLRGASGLKRWPSWLKEVSARGRHKKHIQLESIYSVSQQTSNTHQLPFILEQLPSICITETTYWSWSSLWIVHISCECALQIRTVHITCHPIVFVESREPRDAAKVLQYMIEVSRREHNK